MNETVEPIKNLHDLNEIEDTLKHNFKYGVRNYTIWKVGEGTLLRASDVLKLKCSDVYDNRGNVRTTAYTHDKKTGKQNILTLKPIYDDLVLYRDYRLKHGIYSKWLFPSSRNPDRHITRLQFYKVLKKVADLTNIKYLGTHSMRKTGAYQVYKDTHGDIAMVQSLLNQSSEKVTLRYLGLNSKTKINVLNHIKFY